MHPTKPLNIMKANLNISNIYYNKGLNNFFFRDQALKTLDEFVHKAKIGAEDALEELDEITEDLDIDEVEECFYSMSLNELEDEFCIELEEDDPEEEEPEEDENDEDE